jgi:hypothetical protein
MPFSKLSSMLSFMSRLLSEDASLLLGLAESEADGKMLRIALFRMSVFNCMSMYNENNAGVIMLLVVNVDP